VSYLQKLGQFSVLLNDFTFSDSAGNKNKVMYSDQPQKTNSHGNNISVEKNKLFGVPKKTGLVVCLKNTC